MKSAALTLKMIRVVDLVKQFRQTHWSLVVHYILEKMSCTHGSGGSNAMLFIPNQLLTVSDFIIELA